MSMLSELGTVRQGRALYQKMRIAGKLVDNEQRIEVRNPFNGALVGTVPKATVQDIQNAFRSARRSIHRPCSIMCLTIASWWRMKPSDRFHR